MPKISGITYNKRCGARRGKRPAFTVGRSQTSAATVKSAWRILKKLKISLAHYPPISLPGICPKDSTPYSTDASSAMLIASLLTRVRQWKQMLYNQHIDNELFYIYTVEYYLELKKNEVITFSGNWMEIGQITVRK